jgi:nickel transport protein
MNPYRRFRRTACQALLGGLLLLWAMPAQGHRVLVFAWVEGDTIHTESSFGGGSPVRRGTIEVYDDRGEKLLTGTTDDQGRFSFPAPGTGDLKVVVLAGMGHTAHWMVRAQELAPVTAAPPPGHASPGPGAHRQDAPAPSGNADGAACVDARTVERIVQQALERTLGALEARLAARESRWRDIFAGIGYIFGLVGVATYVRYKKKEGK